VRYQRWAARSARSIATIGARLCVQSVNASAPWWSSIGSPSIVARRARAAERRKGDAFPYIKSQQRTSRDVVNAVTQGEAGGLGFFRMKAARIDGIPRWRVYFSIVLPMLAPSVATAH